MLQGLAWCAVLITSASAWAAEQTDDIDFVHDIVPLLEQHCGECHLGDARQGGFSMNTRDDLAAGGDSGLAGLVAGKPDESELLRRITSTDPDERMPSDGEPLPPAAIERLTAWVAAGGTWEPGFAFQSTLWEPPLALQPVNLPDALPGRDHPLDRVIDAVAREQGREPLPAADDRQFIRRVTLDLTGLLPPPDEVEAYAHDTSPGKRNALVERLLGEEFDARLRYAEHWLTFWNDLLRNDYTGTGFITGGRKQITTWLHQALVENMPYDEFVRELIAPSDAARGFIDGIVWRGTVNSSQTVPIQFAQNVGQTFLGINLKCASCHDSFVDRWTLQETYDLAAVMAKEPLELHRCDKATGVMASPGWMFEDLGQVDPAAPPEDRLVQLAALITHRDNGWLSRNLANRIWARLMGRGIVHPVDALRTEPWSEDLLELLATDLVEHDWDIKHLLRTICTSEAYAAITPAYEGTAESGDRFGPLPRRLTAEQFFDSLWQLTGTAPEKPDGDVNRIEQPTAAANLPTPAALWVWSNATAASPPGEALTFRVRFPLSKPLAHAAVVMTADNEATLRAGSNDLGTATDWGAPVAIVVTPHLHAGDNELRIRAMNGEAGGPAALRAEVVLHFADGTHEQLGTGASWEWSATPADEQSWQPAVVIESQSIWERANAAFAQLVATAGQGQPAMVRASLVKCTPLMAALGRPNRDQVVTSRPTDLTTLEAIELANEQSLADQLAQGGERILAEQGPTADAIAEWLFMAALSRPPRKAELAACRDILGDQPTSQTVADCLWAILMLPEFQLIR